MGTLRWKPRVIRWNPTSGRAELEADTKHVAMVLRYLGLEKSDVRRTSTAGRCDLEELKRVGRYLGGRPVGSIVFEPQTSPGVMDVFCDADHAGDVETRKCRSGVAVTWSHA